MVQEAHMEWMLISVVALAVVVIWVFRKGAKAKYQKDAEIPFQDGDNRGGA